MIYLKEFDHMKRTTLGYIEFDDKYLMLYRNVDKSDGSLGKWLGVGGKIENDETEDICFIREVQEETGITLNESDIVLRGIIDFKSDSYESERMYLYTATTHSDYFNPLCNEGNLKWINKNEILSLNMWEGDHVFLERLLNSDSYFEMSLIYGGKNGEELVDVSDKLLFP